MLKKLSLAAAAAGLFLAPLAVPVPAHAAVNVKAGVLTCHVEGGVGLVAEGVTVPKGIEVPGFGNLDPDSFAAAC